MYDKQEWMYEIIVDDFSFNTSEIEIKLYENQLQNMVKIKRTAFNHLIHKVIIY